MNLDQVVLFVFIGCSILLIWIGLMHFSRACIDFLFRRGE